MRGRASLARPPLTLTLSPLRGARGLWLAALLLFPIALHAQITITFPAAVERAMRMRAGTTTYADHASMLDALPFHTMPTVRAETAFSSAENLNLLSERVDRFDAFTAVVSVDYPLLDGGAERRRVAALRADAQILRRRAVDEAEDVFRETLEAFAQLYTAEQRINLLHSGAARAAELRQRARVMLESGEINNITATQWQDQALATESQLVDLELQRLEAETRLKQLIGDTSSEGLRASLVLDDEPMLREIKIEKIVETDAAVARASLVQERQRLALQEATALRRPQVLLTAFGGVAAVPSTYQTNADEGTFGIYGLRVSLSLPMFDPAAARRLAEARLQLEEATRVRAVTETATRNRIDLLWLALAAAEKRIKLLTDAVEVAKQRQESVTRLVLAGVRPEADLVETANALARRESDLLAVRVDRWKLQQRVRYVGQASARPITTANAGGLKPALH
ncbi:MAG TPA: TolC family protein [Thermoanaerobaculia bacterium]|nr:TolC family protein [Thermoanaerobaculia bacterium]